ncbi:MAG: phage holin family protein [Dehalococcoidia bacterium]|nr:phage holin family protein [Dehalococcoidia bacterium]
MRERGVFIRLDGGGPDWSWETLALRFAINLLGLWLASEIVPGIEVGDWQSLLAGTAIFAIVNMLLRPLAYFLSCCLILATFGFFVLVVNALLLAFTAWVSGSLGLAFEVDGFWSAFFGALIISVVSLTANVLVRTRGRRM